MSKPRPAAKLYDHGSDPEELQNLANATEHARTVADLKALLRTRATEKRSDAPR